MSVEINNLTNFKINKKLIKKIAQEILPDQKISLALVDQETIKKINKEYRKINKATDVLSFNDSLEENPFYNPEIIICPEKTDNFYQVFIHGILHILGHDHKNKKQASLMKEKEQYYLKKYE
jgi:probable rRNA maturation factor